MHALIVIAHPDPQSLTHAVAGQVARGIEASRSGHTFEIADLSAEGFDPRFNTRDVAQFRGQAEPPADVLAEHARLDRTDALVLVYPVYWWSFPGLLKGWIDRVFVNGWAYRDVPGAKLEKLLGRLRVHLLAVGGADMRTYEKHGYTTAMKTGIDHGIFGYCGAPVVTSELLLPENGTFPDAHFETARSLGQRLFGAPGPDA